MNAPIRSMPELLNALRARRDELELTHETIDAISGLQPGYTSKLLAPKPIKNLGPLSFESLLGALGIGIVVVEDPEQRKLVESRWQKRVRPQKAASASIPASIPHEVPMELQITHDLEAKLVDLGHMKSIAKLGGIGRAKRLGKRARRRIATRAARARWDKRLQS
jgi:hypothetical protein